MLGGAGIGVLSGYLVAPEIEKGTLVHILPDWAPPSIEVNMIFPTKREMAPLGAYANRNGARSNSVVPARLDEIAITV